MPEYASWLLPFSYETTDCIFDYIDQNTVLVFYGGDDGKYLDEDIDDISERLALLKSRFKIIPDTHSLYLAKSELNENLSKFRKIYISEPAYKQRRCL